VNPYSSYKETNTYFIKKSFDLVLITKKRIALVLIMFEIIHELFKYFNGRTAKYTMNIHK
jgi:hypothetical protein